MTRSSQGFRDLSRLIIVVLAVVIVIVIFWRPESKSSLQQAREAEQADHRDEARSFYLEHLDAHPEDSSVRLEFAKFLSDHDGQRALAELSRISEDSEEWFEAQRLTVQLYEESGQFDQAQSLLEQLLVNDGSDGDLHFWLARIYDRSGKNLSALQQTELALKKNPELSDAYLLKALLLASFDRFPEMIMPLRECLRRRPDDLIARLNLALAYRRSGELELAGRTLETGSEQMQRLPEFWLERALLAKDRGETKLAQQSVERALEFNSNLLEARLLKGELLLIEGHYGLAREELKPLYQVQRSNRQFLSLYARAAALSGDQDLAAHLTRELARLLETP